VLAIDLSDKTGICGEFNKEFATLMVFFCEDVFYCSNLVLSFVYSLITKILLSIFLMTTRIGISIFLAIIVVTPILLAGGSSASTVAAATGTVTNSTTGVNPAKTTSTTTTTTTTTTTPIKHLVVILQENVAFDHYFGTYPNATNLPSEPKFVANPHTPSINGLNSAGLLTNNNTNSAHPFRLDRSQVITCDNNHAYAAEQKAYDGGLLDKFVQYAGPKYGHCDPNQVMGYFDGNTVTALWNYAQHFAISDNFYGSNFGPSTPGHINLISGQTIGALPADTKIPPSLKFDGVVNGTLIGDIDPKFDDCSRNSKLYNVTVAMQGKNIGDLMNAKGVTWGWFSGGFRLLSKTGNATLDCNSRQSHTSTSEIPNKDYYPDVEPFQYYNSTANPHHLPPTSVEMVGHTDQANHQYDLTHFWNASEGGNMPSVSFIKAPTYQDGHPEISDPLEEQTFLVNTVNRLESLPEWNSTAVIITWDDSDGWYDHVMPPIVSKSDDPINDALLGRQGLCGHAPTGAAQDRCGYGPR